MTKELTTTVHPHCGALIDQDQTIGGDPVGHACHNAAELRTAIDGQLFMLCAKCAAAITGQAWDRAHAELSVSLNHYAHGVMTYWRERL